MSERTLPLFALNTVLLPGALLPLHIFEQRYRRMVADLLEGTEREFVVLLIKEGDEVVETPFPGVTGKPPVTYEVGTVARVVQAQQLADGRSVVLCSGRERVRLIERSGAEPYPVGRFAPLPDGTGRESDPLVEQVRQAVRRVFEALRRLLPPDRIDGQAEIERAIDSIPAGAADLSYFVARVLFTASNDEKQRLLEARDPIARLNLALPLVLLEERLASQRRRAGPGTLSLN